MEFYDEELYLDDEIAQMFSNVYRVDFELSSYVRFAKPLLKLVGFRYAPFELKKKCIFKMAAIDELVKVENAQEKYSFSQQDHIFKSQLDQRGISEQDTQAKFQLCAQLRVCSQAGGNPVYPRFSQPDNSESWDDVGNGI